VYHLGHLSQNENTVAEGISGFVFYSHFVAKSERVVLKELNSSPMSRVQLLLRVDILQSLMIREENELMQQKVMSPIAKCLNHRIEFLIIGGVSLSDFIQHLTKVSN